MTKKIDLINSAYSKMRISGITVSPKGEEIALAVDVLEDMMAEIGGECMGYNFEESPDVNSESGLERKYHNAVKNNLAIRLIPDYNKVVPQILYSQASASMSAVSGMVALDNIREVSAPSRMPVGSGHRVRNRYQRYNYPHVLPENDCDTNKITVEDINDYEESFSAYLEGETIASFTIAVTTALTVVSSSNTDDVVSYRIQAATTDSARQTVTIKVTTSSGRIETRLIEFEVNA